MSRPTIQRAHDGALRLVMDSPAVTWALTRDDAVMLAMEIAGCVPGLIVVMTGERADSDVETAPLL